MRSSKNGKQGRRRRAANNSLVIRQLPVRPGPLGSINPDVFSESEAGQRIDGAGARVMLQPSLR